MSSGKQFSKEEFDKFQNGLTAKDYKGNTYTPVTHKVDRRPIGELNCYHYIFSIVLGVSKSNYSNEQLNKINKQNEKGFEYDGKHYTNYEGTQLQRQIELELRKSKDEQIIARASDNQELINKSQTRINLLTTKYNQLNKTSGLKSQIQRARVSGYRKVSIK